MPRFEDAPQEVLELVARIRRSDYRELDEAKVTIKTMMAFGPKDEEGEPTAPALKLHGYPCLGVIKITSYEARVAGHDDAILKLDGDRWKELAEEDKEALVAHELHHLQILRDKYGAVRTDECSRPKMRARLHDVQVGWFVDIARRYGVHSQEVQQAHFIRDKHGQLLFGWAEQVDDDAQDHEEKAETERLKSRKGVGRPELAPA